MDMFEQRGMNYALWLWETSWEAYAEDAFNFRHGPDPDNHADVESSNLIEVIVKYWGRNTIRPSNVTFTRLGDVDGNGSVTPFDASLVLQHVVGKITLTQQQQASADVTGNGSISALDATEILMLCIWQSTKSGRVKRIGKSF